MTSRPHQAASRRPRTNRSGAAERTGRCTTPLVVDVERDGHCHSGQRLLIDPHSAAADVRLRHR